MNKPLIAIPIGDPAGVGPEITAMALADSKVTEAARCIIAGDKKSWNRLSGLQELS